ncbi:MAG: organomercurial lyase [Nitriliruptoraceae bacterium]
MAGERCACCDGIVEQSTETERTANWIRTETSVLDAELPEALRSTFDRFLGQRVETVGDWVDALGWVVDGSVAVEDLCLSRSETDHVAITDDQTHCFACFYDAVILAALIEEPVEVHTESPEGTAVELRASDDGELTTSSETAVFSFGIDGTVDPPVGETPTLERGYAAICPYVKAFPTPAASEQWAETVAAPTVATTPADATELAAALAE